MREQQWQQQQAEYARQQQERAAMQGAHAAAIIPGAPGMPGQEADNPGGTYMAPTPAQPAGFDDQKYIQALRTNPLIDPAKALAYQQLITKDTPFDKPKLEHWTPESAARYAQTRNPRDLVAVGKPDASPVGKINPSDFTTQSVAAFIAGGGKNYDLLVPIDKRPQTTVSVKNFAETEEEKAIGKARGELFTNINMGSQRAQAKITSLNAIKSLMSDVDTSPLTPAGNAVAGVLKGFGVEIDPKLPRKQAAEALMNKLALESRSTADGGGMPGAMSDKDREFLMGMNPSMSQTKEGRDLLIQVQIRLAKREQEIAQWAREYRAQNGRFDEGFQDYMAQKSAQSPLFADLPAQPQAAPGGVVDFNALRKRKQGK